MLRRASLDDIACGCPVDHPDFDAVLGPLFDRMLERPVDDAAKAGKGTASATLTIARARYTVSATWKGDWLNFDVARSRPSNRSAPMSWTVRCGT
jgi:hypothetical protein